MRAAVLAVPMDNMCWMSQRIGNHCGSGKGQVQGQDSSLQCHVDPMSSLFGLLMDQCFCSNCSQLEADCGVTQSQNW